VYWDLDDYIYFTTNSSSGAGYCYSFDFVTGTQMWSAAATSGNKYALQGFSAANQFLIYGDDGDYLYIVHP
jgi:outer membrane protein assembly factor BamB